MQFATVNVKRKSVASMRARLLQLRNILVKSDEEIAAVVTSAGTAVSAKQFLNILFMFVTEAVLNNGTEVREEKLIILLMFVTEAVLNSGTEVSEEQLLSMPCMFVTRAVLNSGTEVSEEQLPNMLFMSVTEAVSKSGTEVSEEHVVNIRLVLVTVVIEPAITTFCKTEQFLNKLLKLVIAPK